MFGYVYVQFEFNLCITNVNFVNVGSTTLMTLNNAIEAKSLTEGDKTINKNILDPFSFSMWGVYPSDWFICVCHLSF